jgi:hypothetical protein
MVRGNSIAKEGLQTRRGFDSPALSEGTLGVERGKLLR